MGAGKGRGGVERPTTSLDVMHVRLGNICEQESKCCCFACAVETPKWCYRVGLHVLNQAVTSCKALSGVLIVIATREPVSRPNYDKAQPA